MADPVADPVAGSVADEDLWFDVPVLAGGLIRLEPLVMEHAPGYLAAAGSRAAAAEVFRWLQYAMVDDDWPAAKTALVARLAAGPGRSG